MDSVSDKWSDRVWNISLPVFEAIKQLPFIRELAAGTLSPDRFAFYISQDSRYIDDYSRVLAHIASRLEDMDDVSTFLEFAGDGVAVEKSLHAGFHANHAAEKSDACLFYTSYLKSQAWEDVAVECAAILPCFWIYQRTGEYILSIANLEHNPYREWILTYSDPAFDVSTRRAIAICDKLASKADESIRLKMTDAYMHCCRLEWLFWDTAYRKEMRFLKV